MERGKSKHRSHKKNLKRFIVGCFFVVIGGVVAANLFYILLYSRTTSTNHEYPYISIYDDGDDLCVNTSLLNLPPIFVVPSLGVKLIIDEEPIPLWKMSVDLDRRSFSSDILYYKGDEICTQHGLDIGTHNLEIIQVSYPNNLRKIVSFVVHEDGTITLDTNR